MCFVNKEHKNWKNTFREQGNTRKTLLETKEHGPPLPPPPPPHPFSWEALLISSDWLKSAG